MRLLEGIRLEYPLRGETFVTRKITRALCRIFLGMQDCLYLGNMNALRDLGHAKDYLEMQWLMLQHHKPHDYVIGTGEQHSVREFVKHCDRELGLAIRWEGKGIDEKVINPANGKTIVAVDKRYFRPTEVDTLLGDPPKAKQNLCWEPKISFESLVREMTQPDHEKTPKDELCYRAGFEVFNYNENSGAATRLVRQNTIPVQRSQVTNGSLLWAYPEISWKGAKSITDNISNQ